MCVWCSPHVMFFLLKYSNCSHVGVDELKSGRIDRTYKLYPQKEYHSKESVCAFVRRQQRGQQQWH